MELLQLAGDDKTARKVAYNWSIFAKGEDRERSRGRSCGRYTLKDFHNFVVEDSQVGWSSLVDLELIN